MRNAGEFGADVAGVEGEEGLLVMDERQDLPDATDEVIETDLVGMAGDGNPTVATCSGVDGSVFRLLNKGSGSNAGSICREPSGGGGGSGF